MRKGMVIDMAAIYKRMIQNGQLTLEQVPERWRTQVRALLAEA